MDKANNYIRMEFSARDQNVAAARLAAASFCAELGFSFTDIEEIKVAVSEGVSNAVIHGYGGDENRRVEMTMRSFDDHFEIDIKDEGRGIENVEQAMEPGFSAMEDRMGLGFVFMGSFMDALKVESAPNKGTLVRMRKRIPAR